MRSVGIDIGSSGTKYVVMEDQALLYHRTIPTGFSSVKAAQQAKEDMETRGYDMALLPCISTGYGRGSVPYAAKTLTEITCHGRGAAHLMQKETFSVIDIGGQDTKVIRMEGGSVKEFTMNDKCAAGTGRFLEVMASAMELEPEALCRIAKRGGNVHISSMCTTFAESEVISLIGQGVSRQDNACGIVESIVNKVVSQCGMVESGGSYYLTGGLCECPYIAEMLSRALGAQVETGPMARYAGAVGAALYAREL